MRIRSAVLLALLTAPAATAPLSAQSTDDERAVIAVVQRTFDAMTARDTATFRAVFAPGARIVSTFTNREGKPGVREILIDDFVGAIAGFEVDVVERIFDPQVRIVDNLATVWADYDLHAGGELSHCGVDAFHLARTADGWKIVHVTDTQKREGCPSRPPL